MLTKIVNKIRQRHFWRKATFNELAAFYVSEMLRAIALNLATLFIYVFLYNKGYSLISVVLFCLYYHLLYGLFTIFAAGLMAYFGAKKCLFVSNMMYIPTLLSFAAYDQFGEVVVMIGGWFLAFSNSVHSSAYSVLFSEVKNVKNSGKEVSYMMIIQKAMGIVTPVLGGLIASRFGAEFSMWAAALLFTVAAFSLFQSQTTAKKQHALRFRSFPWRTYCRAIIFQFGRGFEVVSNAFWPIYIIMFMTTQERSYEVVGLLSSFSALIIFASAWYLGRLLDRHQQRIGMFFRLGVLIQSLAMALRIVVQSIIGLAAIELLWSLGNVAHMIPYDKARYDAYDRSGSRVVLELALTSSWMLGRIIGTVVLLACLWLISNWQLAFHIYFVLSAVAMASFSLSQYPLFKTQKRI